MRPTFHIAWIAIRELLYEKVFYLLVVFAFVALGFSALLGRLTYAEQQKLTLDFMLGGIQLSMLIFSVFMGISLFQRELNLGSISMVLSKPIHRSSFLIGKYLGQVIVQTCVTLFMALLTVVICLQYETPLVYTSIVQTILMTVFEVWVVTAVAYFFAVVAGPVTAAVGTIGFYLLGQYREASEKVVEPGIGRGIWSTFRLVIPNLDIFNMKALASYGFSISWNEIGIAAAYAGVCVGVFLSVAALCFQRRDILT